MESHDGIEETPHAAVLAHKPGNTQRRRSALSLLASGLTILGVIPMTLVAQYRTATPAFASSSVVSLSAGEHDTLAV
jgi:hypothetical protein